MGRIIQHARHSRHYHIRQRYVFYEFRVPGIQQALWYTSHHFCTTSPFFKRTGRKSSLDSNVWVTVTLSLTSYVSRLCIDVHHILQHFFLQLYNLNCPGLQIPQADALSRLPLTQTIDNTPIPQETVLFLQMLDATPATSSLIRQCTRRDPILSKIINMVYHGHDINGTNLDFKPYQV